MEIDLSPMFKDKVPDQRLHLKIREMKNARVRFSVSRNNQYISNVVIWVGEGRERKERRLNLSIPQGRFLYHLPFPSAEFQPISKIMENAGIDGGHVSEVLDIVNVLSDFNVIEIQD